MLSLGVPKGDDTTGAGVVKSKHPYNGYLEDKKAEQKTTKKAPSTKENQRLFLKRFQELDLNISKACESIGIDRGRYYKWRDNDPEFAAALNKVKRILVERAEHNMARLLDSEDERVMLDTSRFVLERLDKVNYSQRQEIQTQADVIIIHGQDAPRPETHSIAEADSKS